jgi:hypothetical protein
MSQGIGQHELQEKTQKLLHGPLKHVRAAALAAALLPLASVAAAPASAQELCPSGGICGFVFNDTNDNGIQDAGELGIDGAKLVVWDGDTFITDLYTNSDGQYSFANFDVLTYTISVPIPQGTEPSPAGAGSDDSIDSDGALVGTNSVATVDQGLAADFGFFKPAVHQPGTGTPGYWKNHLEAWTVPGVTVGGIYYTKAQAISWLGRVGKDKLTTMFSSLVPAMLNVMIGNQDSCVGQTIVDANAWMATNGPLGAKTVLASSPAWAAGEPLHIVMDDYNNGRLCAPHRN